MRRTLIATLIATLASPAWAQAPTVEHAWSRAAVKTGAAYVTITGHGAPDRLISATTPVAERAEIHESMADGTVMRMRPVAGVAIPASAPVVLAPGGLHIMLVNLRQPLVRGQHFPLTLVFEKAGTVESDVTVEAAGAAMPMAMPMAH